MSDKSSREVIPSCIQKEGKVSVCSNYKALKRAVDNRCTCKTGKVGVSLAEASQLESECRLAEMIYNAGQPHWSVSKSRISPKSE
ncbi:hypothetical protein TNCT_4671 [Trichonephila clavata]|uniref:Uncharacterized protein n=1 Tax=Trichonephila clavata TaxID=2740835 RepID=A0A8X6KY40_TRICU|nr:hypothetical protein TNCT_4671 [Trichonephila clavata]